MSAPSFFALIPCAGAGLRAGGSVPKQYQMLADKPLVAHTLEAFAQVQRITQTVVVIAPQDEMFSSLGLVATALRCGGASRAQSVQNGLQALRSGGCQPTDWVLVHDAARCLITPAQIDALIDECQHDSVGGLLACPVADTLKVASAARVQATLDRSDKWVAQTPQMFRVGDLQTSLEQAWRQGLEVTDEASALEAMGYAPRLIRASAQNFKVTYPEDFALAQAILNSRKKVL